jgi:molybdopterin-guanine dinucleotide biosynthesis protein A
MGGEDKGWLLYQQRPLIEHMLERLQPQVDDIVISCNRNLARYRALGKTVVTDTSTDYLGPMAGIAAAAPWCHRQWIQLCPCDTPAIPLDLSRQLLHNAETLQVDAVIPEDSTGPQYLCALVHQRTLASASLALANRQLAVKHWLTSIPAARVSINAKQHAFVNINSIGQLERRV